MQPLKFIQTMTVKQFKNLVGAEKLQVKSQPMRDAQGNILRDKEGKAIFHPAEDNKLFFVCGGTTGAVAVKGIPQHPMVSLVQGDATERNPDGKFYLLHEEGQGSAPTLAEF
jgi:hypothetical protein